MNRREFVKSIVAAGLGMTFPGDFASFADSSPPAEKIDLVVARGSSPGKITRSAVAAAGGMGAFVSPGEIVVVKPNIGWDRTPEQAATTNPEVVATLVKLCYDAGAKTVKVFDRPVPDPRRCYKQSGIADAAKAAGAEVSYIDDRKFRDVKIDGLALKNWSFYGDVLEADKIINVPIAKQHGSAKLTLSMKNWMGVIGGWRGRIHFSLNECLVDFAQVIKPSLTVLDAVRILTKHGPQGGNLEDVKKLDTVVVGKDQVAVDAFATSFFDLRPTDLEYLRLAQDNGIGTMDLSQLRIKRIQL